MLARSWAGDWSQRQANRHTETAWLRDQLKARGYSDAQMFAALQ